MMRKSTIAIVLIISLGMFLTSCGESKKEKAAEESQTEMHDDHKDHDSDVESHDHSEHMATAVYQCPMKCEDEKTYPEPGNCPECKMALKEVETEDE